MNLLDVVIGMTIGIGLGFILGIVVIIYGAAKRKLGKGIVGFLISIITGALFGMVNVFLAIFGPVLVVALLIRWISEKPEDKSSEEMSSQAQKKHLKYFSIAAVLLLILVLIYNPFHTRPSSHHYTCPASKYVLSNSDFHESGWKLETVGVSTSNNYLTRHLEGDYSCLGTGKALDLSVSIAPAVYIYSIYVFETNNQAQNEFEELRQEFLNKGSIQQCSIGNECFEYSVASEAYWLWIRDNNAIVGIYSAGIGASSSSVQDFAEKILDKMHKLS